MKPRRKSGPHKRNGNNGHNGHGRGGPPHPGETLLKEFIERFEISQSELAQMLGVSFPRLNLILHGKRSITPDTALRLERIFGKPAMFWLDQQAQWDVHQTKQSARGKAIARIPRHPELRRK